MLHLETVAPRTFAVLEKLMTIDALQAFNIVGGTALSLYYGHRTSIDLDLFCAESFDQSTIITSVNSAFEDEFKVQSSSNFEISGSVNNVKLTFKWGSNPIICPIITKESLRLIAPEDILTMKVKDILDGGNKNDFRDIAELLNHFEINDFIELYQQKYGLHFMNIVVPEAIVYFDDAEDSEDPVSLNGLDWNDVKNIIRGKVRNYLA